MAMKTRLQAFCVALCLGSAIPAVSHAATYTFTQTYSEGATFSGTFTGSDDDLNGQIFSTTEITSFSAVFSGNSFVPSLIFNTSSLAAGRLIFDLDGSAVLGDGVGGASTAVEGIIIKDTTGSYAFDIGLGPSFGLYTCDGVDTCGSIAEDFFIDGQVFDTTASQFLVSGPGISTTTVPLPAGAFMLLGGLGLLAAQSRRKA